MSFDLQFSWLDAPSVKDRAEALTWASVGLRHGDVVLSRLLDERLRAVRDEFFGSTLPLAEWIAEAWPRLIEERRVLPREHPSFFEWQGFHNLRAARQGGALPNLGILRKRDEVFEILIVPDAGDLLPGISVRFLTSARFEIEARSLSAELARLVEAALARVPAGDPRRDRLAARWKAAQAPEAQIAGRLGMDDERLSGAERQLLARARADARWEATAALAEASATPEFEARLTEGLLAAAQIPGPNAPTQWWSATSTASALGATKPWTTGWMAAAQFREDMGLRADMPPPRALAPWLEETCGWPVKSQLAQRAEPIVTGVETVYLTDLGAPPLVVTTHRTRPAKRFRVAAALYHAIFGAGRQRRAVIPDSALVPGLLSEANAFAAELLAPVEALRAEEPTGAVWTWRQVQEISGRLGVSRRVVEHQIQNRGLGVLSYPAEASYPADAGSI